MSGNKQTTVDYIFADVEATSMISRCCALPMEGLNTPDHLPLLADMLYTPLRQENARHVLPRVEAAKTGMIDEYRQVVEKCLNHFINNSYDCVGDVERELNYVGKLLCNTAGRTLPLSLHRKNQDGEILFCLLCVHRAEWHVRPGRGR